MSSISSSLSSLALTSPLFRSRPCLGLQPARSCYQRYGLNGHGNVALPLHVQLVSRHPSRNLYCAIAPSNDGTVSVINFEEVMEKDWSFLEHTDSSEENKQRLDKIISAGEIVETSKVLIAIGSEEFVDRVVESSKCSQLLVVHDSLFMLACIKEKYDKVKCWQGELIYVPDKWTPFDVVFLYFLPALPFELGQVLETLGKRCLPGARVVISHPQGRQVAEEQREQYPDVVVSNLPEKMKLQNVAADHSFKVVKFVDEPGFYLAILKFEGQNNNS